MPYEEAYKIVQKNKRLIINRDFSLFILKYISEVIVSYDHYRNHLQTEGPELYGVLVLISTRSFLHQELWLEPKLVKQITEVAEDDALKQVDVIIGLLSIIKLREQMLL